MTTSWTLMVLVSTVAMFMVSFLACRISLKSSSFSIGISSSWLPTTSSSDDDDDDDELEESTGGTLLSSSEDAWL